MRPPQSPVTAENKYPELSSTTTPTCNPNTCRWRPYSNSNHDFEANTILVLIILFCALTCALALNAAIRCFLRGSSQQRSPEASDRLSAQQRKPTLEVADASLLVAPTVVYLSGMKLAGAAAECVICLSDFVEGDVIQVLERCKHGFHVQCIQQWLLLHHSCPTCRCSTCSSSSPPLQQLIHHNSQFSATQTRPSTV